MAALVALKLAVGTGCESEGGAVAGGFGGRWVLATDAAVIADPGTAAGLARDLKAAGAGGVVVLVDDLTFVRDYVAGPVWAGGELHPVVRRNLETLRAEFGSGGLVLCPHNAHGAPGTFDAGTAAARVAAIREVVGPCEVLLGWEESRAGLAGYRAAEAAVGGAWVNFVGQGFEAWASAPFGWAMHSWVVSAGGDQGRVNWDGRLDVGWETAVAAIEAAPRDAVVWWPEMVRNPVAFRVWLRATWPERFE